MNFERIFLIVLDSVGIGAMPDAAAYGDAGSDTLGHLAERRPLRLPHLRAMGLANIRRFRHLEPVPAPTASWGCAALASPGKDTTTGHWEIAGIRLAKPLPLYPQGFPPELMREFERRIGRHTLGNCAASGTAIIQELGAEHMKTGWPIVYTSADSVFQIAAHKEAIPLDELYGMCAIAREILRGDHEVGRVIARPFEGVPGRFARDQAARRDYALAPPPGMLLDRLAEAGVAVHSIGKIAEVFLGRGIATSVKTANNGEGMARILEAANSEKQGLIFANLVDFDSLYGHRNDAEGYSQALEAFDTWLPGLLEALGEGDLLMVTADHGCDPTTRSTDHSREYVPLLAYARRRPRGVDLGARETLSDIGQTVAGNFGTSIAHGASFLRDLL